MFENLSIQRWTASLFALLAIAGFGLAHHFHDVAYTGILLMAVPMAAYAWERTEAVLLSAVCAALLALLIFLVESNFASFATELGLLVLFSIGTMVVYFEAAQEALQRHAERQIVEAIRDDISVLQQKVDGALASLEQSNNRQRQYSLLNEAARLLGSSLELDQLAEIILNQVTGVLENKPACFTLFIFDRNGREILRKQKDLGAGFQYPAEMSCESDKLNAWALSQGTPLMVKNLNKDFRFKGLDISNIPGRCFMISPLVLEGKITGLVRCEARQEELFDNEDQRLLDTLVGLSRLALENAKLYRETQELAVTDGLTKLLLRRPLLERLSAELRRSEKGNTPTVFILADIDHFKQVNDQHGHPVGDLVLKEIAAVIKRSVRDVDLCGRYGGEEFAVILSATDLAGGKVVAERIREAVAATPFRLENKQQLSLSLSLGLASYPADAQGIEELIQRADMALYFSKQNGRNRVSTFTDLKSAGEKA